MDTLEFHVPIPKGYRIFIPTEAAGAAHYRSAYSKMLKKGKATFELEPEPNNEHDPNAVKIIAEIDGLFGSKRLHAGYLPRKVAALVAEKDAADLLMVRPTELWIGDTGGLRFSFDLLGPKAEYNRVVGSKEELFKRIG